MKQTAVEWLLEKIRDTSHDLHHLMKVRGVFEQAKQIEREQIIDAHNYGFTEGTCFGASPIGYKFVESEQYYNETFNNDEK